MGTRFIRGQREEQLFKLLVFGAELPMPTLIFLALESALARWEYLPQGNLVAHIFFKPPLQKKREGEKLWAFGTFALAGRHQC